MKSILVIAPNSGLGPAVRAILDPGIYRVHIAADVRETDSLLSFGSIECCIIDAELTTVEPIRLIEKIHARLPHCPLIIFTANKQWEWEEDAYLLGVQHVLSKPVRSRLLNSLLERLPPPARRTPDRSTEFRARAEMKASEPTALATRTLHVMRDFSSVLAHSLCAESLVKQFLLLLREIIGVNRAAVFLCQPSGVLGSAIDLSCNKRLKSMCALGLPPGLLEHFELSVEAGIGGYLFSSGRILRRDSAETERDPEMQKEFELLGAEVAIPILDRESLVGVAVFDGRVTGDALTREELSLIFHLLEEVGMAVKNIWLHDQLAGNHELLADILRQLSSACVVVGSDLVVLHANDAARQYFRPAGLSKAPFEFSELPQALGSKVFEVLRHGRVVPAFKYTPPQGAGLVYRVTITPFQKQDARVPNAALLLLEDISKIERLHQLEMETNNLRIVKQMAERLAHEIGNAVVPLSTHQQLLRPHAKDPEFIASLDSALTEGVKRVTRLVNQMRFLAGDKIISSEPVPIQELIEEAFRKACEYQRSNNPLLQFENSGQPILIPGDRIGLQHAFAEVILNALQANADAPQVQISAQEKTDMNGDRLAQIEVRDNGAGFSAEAAKKVPEPFFTTRNVGLGLGLAVSSKIIETHRGKLEVPSPQQGQTGLVRISLPLENDPRPKFAPRKE